MIRQPEAAVEADVLALRALFWTLAEPERAQRLLAVMGIDPAGLRERVGDPAVLGATVQFLLANEADLVECAGDLGVKPEALARAAAELDQ